MPTHMFATLGMFIINEFAFLDDMGTPTVRTLTSQGRAPAPPPPPPPNMLTSPADWWWRHLCHPRHPPLVCPLHSHHCHYSHRSALITIPNRLLPAALGMIVDKGADFLAHILATLNTYGMPMCLYHNHPDHSTMR